MQRRLEDLTGRRFDLLVIGGGIHGLFAAYDAAQRGLAVALVERADFGSGLSFNQQRTLHGGLRALQHGNLRKARAQIHERRTWARIAPHLIRPLPFLLGTYGHGRRSRLALRAGLATYDWLGRSRNKDVLTELHLPKSRLESRTMTRRLFPGIDETGLTGGAVWYDYQIRHPDRLTWTVALAAERSGAQLVNYVEALGPLETGDRVTGAHVRDVIGGRDFDVEASVTLLAAGSAQPGIMQTFGVNGAPLLVRAMNLLLNRPARDIAIAARGLSRRMLTAVPWENFVLVGTDQSPEAISGPELHPPLSALESFLADLNKAFPSLHASRSDIRLIHHGLTPAIGTRGQIDLMPESRVIRHDRRGVVSLIGVKYTTARSTARYAVDAVAAGLDAKRAHRCRTAVSVLPHADIADVDGRITETLRDLGLDLDRDVRDHLASWYGTEAPELIRYAAAAGTLSRIDEGTPVIAGEIAFATEFSSAVRLSDVVLRRTRLGSAGHPGASPLRRAAQIVGDTLQWPEARRAEEIAAVEAVYP